MNKKLIQLIFFILLGFLSPSIYADACETNSDSEITSSSDCYTSPDTYRITLYEMGLCQNIDEQTPTLPDIATYCQTTYSNSSGADIVVENNVSSPISGGTNTRPSNGTYTHGYIKVEAKLTMVSDLTFSTSKTGASGGNGTICWTSSGNGTTCGTSLGTTASFGGEIASLACSTPSGNFYCRYETDDGLDYTYAWLVDGNGELATETSYSSSGASNKVKYLIGVAKFTSPKKVSDATEAMEAQFRVTRALNVGISGGTVTFGMNEFKVITTVY
jgi:hypothetical protein